MAVSLFRQGLSCSVPYGAVKTYLDHACIPVPAWGVSDTIVSAVRMTVMHIPAASALACNGEGLCLKPVLGARSRLQSLQPVRKSRGLHGRMICQAAGTGSCDRWRQSCPVRQYRPMVA